MARSIEEAIVEIIKDLFIYIKYLFLSKEEKLQQNLLLVKERYWFQQLLLDRPALNKLLDQDIELKHYFSSRKNVRKLLRDKGERSRFKSWIQNK
ncbi:hypothetical protein [Bacillus sp. FJAT-27245]|uniref:hypothetical protein n=1 Tax=Bacillus sp. FJAT-27245 TaxID=1684144 RepID=UPI0006A7EFED|nr:hypothetical protein [Bacillus sp. FJAT-27245]